MIPVDQLLAWGATKRAFSEGEFIFHEGEHCQFYHQLVSGRVNWGNISEEGREYLQCLVLPGESFGDIPLFDDEHYVSSAVATKESIVIRLPKETFLQKLEENPPIHFEFSRLLASRLRFKFTVQKEMASSDPSRCILALLEFLKGHGGCVCSECQLVKLTRQEIANMTGLRVETVIRVLRRMHDEGQVSIIKGKVYLAPGMREVITPCSAV